MKYLLDTNICSYIVARRPPTAYERFSQEPFQSIGISTITLSELLFGVEKSPQRERNELAYRLFLAPLTVVDFDAAAAAHYGQIRADLARKGTPIGPLDLLIAAHARSRNLTLVTNNAREFVRVPGLTVENWTT
jgi:tRNA(fMet)-specific endonuclease VapC